MNPKGDDLQDKISRAVHAKRVIQFWYGPERRSQFCAAEPYCYGSLADGNETLLCYQVSGHSGLDVPVGWKLYRPALMTDLLVTDNAFTVRRRQGEAYDARRVTFTKVFCEVLPDKSAAPPETSVIVVAPPKPAPPAKRVWGHNELMKRFRIGHWLFPSKDRP